MDEHDSKRLSWTTFANFLPTLVFGAVLFGYLSADVWVGVEVFGYGMATLVAFILLINWSPFSPRTWHIRAILGGLLMATNLAPMDLEFPRIPFWIIGCVLLFYSAREFRSMD